MAETRANLKNIASIGVAGIVVGFFAAYVMFGSNSAQAPITSVGLGAEPSPHTADGGCPITNATATVSGDSMAGIVKDGAEVTVLQGYYACHDAVRGDIVAYNYPGMPIVKKVFGVPGDTLALAKVASGGWHIVVNGNVLVNSANTPYDISASGDRMLSLYINAYHGVIPADAYLILGDVPTGSNDSTAFGLVAIGDFIGKVAL